MIFLGNNEENKFCGFSQKGLIERFGGLWFLATMMGIKRSHKPLFLGIFKHRDFFSWGVVYFKKYKAPPGDRNFLFMLGIEEDNTLTKKSKLNKYLILWFNRILAICYISSAFIRDNYLYFRNQYLNLRDCYLNFSDCYLNFRDCYLNFRDYDLRFTDHYPYSRDHYLNFMDHYFLILGINI